MTDYEKQATDFCTKYGVEIAWAFVKSEPAPDHAVRYVGGDVKTPARNVWSFTIRNKAGRSYASNFTDSIFHTMETEKPVFKLGNWQWRIGRKRPSAYDLLACLTKSDPGSFEDFCGEYGYDTDSRKALDTYLEVQGEWHGVRAVIPAEAFDEFQEIN